MHYQPYQYQRVNHMHDRPRRTRRHRLHRRIVKALAADQEDDSNENPSFVSSLSHRASISTVLNIFKWLGRPTGIQQFVCYWWYKASGALDLYFFKQDGGLIDEIHIENQIKTNPCWKAVHPVFSLPFPKRMKLKCSRGASKTRTCGAYRLTLGH